MTRTSTRSTWALNKPPSRLSNPNLQLGLTVSNVICPDGALEKKHWLRFIQRFDTHLILALDPKRRYGETGKQAPTWKLEMWQGFLVIGKSLTMATVLYGNYAPPPVVVVVVVVGHEGAVCREGNAWWMMVWLGLITYNLSDLVPKIDLAFDAFLGTMLNDFISYSYYQLLVNDMILNLAAGHFVWHLCHFLSFLSLYRHHFRTLCPTSHLSGLLSELLALNTSASLARHETPHRRCGQGMVES